MTGNDQTIGGGSAYGDIQVRVTATGKQITSVGLARLNVSGPLSQQIVNNVVPQLQQQTLSAQSANIQGVSGATYTVQAYRASLQSALDQLGITNPGGSNAWAEPVMGTVVSFLIRETEDEDPSGRPLRGGTGPEPP